METDQRLIEYTNSIPLNHPLPPRLKGWPAIAIFAIFLSVQLAVGMAAGIVGVVAAAIRGLDIQDPQVVSEVTQSIMVPAAAIGLLVAGSVSILVSVLWFRGEIQDRQPTGAAWVVGEPRKLLLAFVVGILIAVAYLAIAPLLTEMPDVETMGPIAKTASKQGVQQTIWMLVALLLAPPVEELLFRGVLFGGMCRSWGLRNAAVVSTVLFVLMHATEMIHFWPAFIFVTLMAIVALWLRLNTRAIGTAIAAHLGYNAVLVISVLLTTR